MQDERFMQEAIAQAKKADFPYGAVIFYKGKIIAKAGTAGRKSIDPTAHAEITAIRKACRKLRQNHLKGATMYSTCEPCPMCFTACWWAGISRLVYGMTLQDSTRLLGQELEVSAATLNKKAGNVMMIKPKFMRAEVLKLF